MYPVDGKRYSDRDVKDWFAILLATSLQAFIPPEAAGNERVTGGVPVEPLDPNDPAVTWLDNSFTATASARWPSSGSGR